jgi:hypothetical protein
MAQRSIVNCLHIQLYYISMYEKIAEYSWLRREYPFEMTGTPQNRHSNEAGRVMFSGGVILL